MSQLKFAISNKHKIAYRFTKRTKKTIVFIHGLQSDMNGKKSLFFKNLARKKSYSYLRFDCSGHGRSSGIFDELSIKDWYSDLKNVLDYLKINKNIILIGSSMGGWLAILYALSYPNQIFKLIGLAPAPDFTERLIWPSLTDANKLNIKKKKIIKIKINKNFYYRYSYNLIFGSRKYLIKKIKKKYKGMVIFFHGSEDESVPYDYNNNLLNSNHFKNIRLITIKNEDHSLSSRNSLKIIEKEI